MTPPVSHTGSAGFDSLDADMDEWYAAELARIKKLHPTRATFHGAETFKGRVYETVGVVADEYTPPFEVILAIRAVPKK